MTYTCKRLNEEGRKKSLGKAACAAALCEENEGDPKIPNNDKPNLLNLLQLGVLGARTQAVEYWACSICMHANPIGNFCAQILDSLRERTERLGPGACTGYGSEELFRVPLSALEPSTSSSSTSTPITSRSDGGSDPQFRRRSSRITSSQHSQSSDEWGGASHPVCRMR